MQTGSTFQISTASTAVFFGNVAGTNFFTGGGTKDFEAGQSAIGAIVDSGASIVQSSATLTATAIRENSLTVNGIVTIPANGTSTGTSKVATLSVTGKLDLNDNHLIVTSGSVGTFDGTNYSGITGLIRSGRNNGTWDGNGIASSLASSRNGITTLAVATAADVDKTTFGGLPVSPTDVLVMYTYTGDANLDGKINADDYFQIDSNYNKPASSLGYFKGDFNYDGRINGDDFMLIDSAFAAQGAVLSSPLTTSMVGGIAAVPEPTALGLLAGVALLAKRRASRR